MIVVLGDEEHQIDNADIHFQSWMQGRSLHERFVVSVETPDELHSLVAKCGKNILNFIRVVICFVRLAILHVGGGERLTPSFKIIEAVHTQGFKVEQMPRLLLNRPLIAIAPRENLSRQARVSDLRVAPEFRGRAPLRSHKFPAADQRRIGA